ncbi:MAG: Zn-ribbon domain-containing OB-fold protein [Verrucomicrobiota bacterium]|jgi:uncharacterized protein
MTRLQEKTYAEPMINLETEPYWRAAREGRLMLKSCNDCGQVHHYPRAICPRCLSSATAWVQATGRGRIYSYSVMRRAPQPYAIAYVTLDEGITMMTNIVECKLDRLAIGQEVEVVFRATEGGQQLPLFRPAARKGSP